MSTLGPFYPYPFQIENGSDFTQSLVVELIFSTANAQRMRVANSEEELLAADFQPYVTTQTHELAAGADGERTVFVQFQNEEADLISDTITLDSTPPQVIEDQELVINGGAITTESRDVTLEFGVLSTSETAAIEFVVVNDTPDIGNQVFYNVPENLTIQHRLSQGDGIKRVYIQYRDKAGNMTPFFFSEIGLNTVTLIPPTFTGLPVATDRHLLTIQGTSTPFAQIQLNIA